METNKNIKRDSELYRKGQALLDAAYEYWEEYCKECEASAVVWLDDDSGHFVLFTRGEYKESILETANRETRGEVRMFEPFIAKSLNTEDG